MVLCHFQVGGDAIVLISSQALHYCIAGSIYKCVRLSSLMSGLLAQWYVKALESSGNCGPGFKPQSGHIMVIEIML